MRNLLTFLFRYRGILVFVLLEIVSLVLLIRNSAYQRAAFFNSANAYTGRVLEVRTQIYDYFRLVDVNKALVTENAQLRQQLYHSELSSRMPDSLAMPGDSTGTRLKADSLMLGLRLLPSRPTEYPLIPARVINQSLRRVDNYLTLNVGSAQGVQPGMGVLTTAGVVGRVRQVSEHYATVTSLLHSKTTISAKLKRDGTFGTIRWLGDDPTHASLDYIPRQNVLVRGDTVVTSGYNAIFPEGVMIGTVDRFTKEPDKNFWTVQVHLAVNFSNLSYVYVIGPQPRAAERDTLETRSGMRPAAAAKGEEEQP
ncbi:rod shape-determining protein MreC [Hymenobacter busanensis]|uniref:Cell shape-determining protein MreC n=1 Tax=Hymenobacter busanensis TaxID=2607656 RepID=A0A7L4ZWV3_9BACT|nr:rod shape-determining protein MreC [Hymenobacter busanensis]KAA9325296.1 rod shape-determining protein MreC [Hymenobacter busanensis]QHJ07711.1 rod shape-determining protein MreC [Hymenobacter busanensis]